MRRDLTRLNRFVVVTGAFALVAAFSCTQEAAPNVDGSSEGGSVPGALQDAEQFLLQAERDKPVAMMSGPADHMAWFDKWIADDMVSTGPDGQVTRDVKALVRDLLSSGAWKVETVAVENIGVRVFGEAAVVTATQSEQSQLNGVDVGGRFQYTHVWANRGGRWQVVAAHTTLLGNP
jgi:hypothetical protein